MATRNDVTGDPLISKSPTDSYRDGWDRIFGKKPKKETPPKKKEPNEDRDHRPDAEQKLG